MNTLNQLELPLEDTQYCESYADGLETGLEWSANWTPGGPWRYSGLNGDKQTESQGKYRAWHAGFSLGLETRLARDESFATWYKANHGSSKAMLYTPT